MWHANSDLWHVKSCSLIRNRTGAPYIGSTESYPLDHQGSPAATFDHLSFTLSHSTPLSKLNISLPLSLVPLFFMIKPFSELLRNKAFSLLSYFCHWNCYICTDTLHPASGGGPGSLLKQGSAGCDGHTRQAESSQAHPALGASAVAPWPQPQPHCQKASHTGCSVPREGPGNQTLVPTSMTMETKDSRCKTDRTLRVHAVSPRELQTLGVGPFLKNIWSLLL